MQKKEALSFSLDHSGKYSYKYILIIILWQSQLFELSSVPAGTIEHKDRPYKPVYVFTQLDVDGGKIIYRPPSTPPHLQELYPYSFAGRQHIPVVLAYRN